MFLAGRSSPAAQGEILDAALRVFAEKGYDGGSMREIATRVGVSEPALYRHFPGKEALFLALIRVGAGRMRDEAFALIDGLERRRRCARSCSACSTTAAARCALNAPMLRTIVPAAARNAEFLEEFRVGDRRAGSRGGSPRRRPSSTPPSTSLTPTRPAMPRVRALFALFVGYFVSSMVLGDQPDEAIVDAALRVMGWEISLAL